MPKTIQLNESTYAELKGYKVGGLTFDDVILRLMEEFDVARFHREYREWQKRVVGNIKRSNSFKKV